MLNTTEAMKLGSAVGQLMARAEAHLKLLVANTDKATEMAEAILMEIGVATHDSAWYLEGEPSADYGRLDLLVTCSDHDGLRQIRSWITTYHDFLEVVDGTSYRAKGATGFRVGILLPPAPEHTVYYDRLRAAKATKV